MCVPLYAKDERAPRLRCRRTASRCRARSPTSKWRSAARTSPRRRSSRWRTRGCITETREASRAADRDRRGVGGHQQLARRPRPSVRRDAGKGDASMRAPLSACCGPIDGERYASRAVAAACRRPIVELRYAGSAFKPDASDPSRRLLRRRTVSSRSLICTGYRALSLGRALDPRSRSDLGGIRTILLVPLRKDDAVLGHFGGLSPRHTAIHRQADHIAAKLCGAGGDRDGERAALDRDARGIGAADRDHRSIAGDQLLAWPFCPSFRCNIGESATISAKPSFSCCADL